MKLFKLLIFLMVANSLFGQDYWNYKQKSRVPIYNLVPSSASTVVSAPQISSGTKVSMSKAGSAATAGDCFDNLDFEFGNFTNWQCYTGTAKTNGISNYVTWNAAGAPVTNRHQIISSASTPLLDPYGKFPRLCPQGGNYSIQLGNDQIGAQAEKVSYTFTIPASRNDFTIEYYYAVVFQDPDHHPDEQPRFRAKVYDVSNGSTEMACASFDYTSTSGLPGFSSTQMKGGSSTAVTGYYKPWSPVTINLSGYAGHTVRLEFITEDCTKSGHFGYAYVDVSSNCTSVFKSYAFCPNANVINLIAPSGYKEYHWWNEDFTVNLGNASTITVIPPPPNSTVYVDLVPYDGFGCRDTAFTVLRTNPITTSTTNLSVCSNTLPFSWHGLTFNAAGSQTATLVNMYGCDSLATLNLSVKQASSSMTNLSLCSTQLPYTWNGLTFTAAGIKTATLVNKVGCDSLATLRLTVKSPTSSTTNLSICSTQLPYNWNGLTFTTAGTKTATLVNKAGCDSLATLNLAVRSATSSTTNLSLCSASLPYVWNELTFAAAGTKTATLTNKAGCDSIATLNLTVKLPSSSTTNLSICSSALPYVWNGLTFAAAGSKTATLVNKVGCDSLATLNLAVRLTSTSVTNQSICSTSLPYVWNGLTFNAAGSKTATLVNKAGCDSLATLNLIVKSPTSSVTNKNICVTLLPYSWNGLTFNAAGSKTATLVNKVGCDSLATLNLTVSGPTSSVNNLTICNPALLPYVWNGLTFNGAGSQTATLVNKAGCDSTATLNLSVGAPTSSTTNLTVCSSQLPFTWNGVTFTAAGTKVATLVNKSGCDSLATLNLSLKLASYSTTNVTICAKDAPYWWNGNSYSSSGAYTYTTVNPVGCDSIATLNLTVNVPTNSTTNMLICNTALPYVWNGLTFNSAGTQTATLVNKAGCDSLATLNLSVGGPTSSVTNLTICNPSLPYSWNGLTFNSAGTQVATLVNKAGCDSTATLNLTVNVPTSSTTNLTICNSQLPYHWNGLTFNAAGTQTTTLVNKAGCDSVATLNLTVNLVSYSTTNIAVCTKDLPYSWNGNSYNAAGVYTYTGTNKAGCDSIATLNLTVNVPTSSSTNLSICNADLPYTWHGLTFVGAGSQTATLVNKAGCDSLATLNLTVNFATSSMTNLTVCSPALPYSWNGLTFNAAGSQTVTLVNKAGCDSVATLNLTVNVPTSSTTDLTICSSQLPYTWNGLVFNAAGSQTAILPNKAGCDSVATLNLSVKMTSSSLLNASVCFRDLPYIWNGVSYTSSGVYTYKTVNAVGCDSVATLNLTVHTRTSSTTNLTICSSELPYTWNGFIFHAGGKETALLVNSIGCDSLATLILKVKLASTSVTNRTICNSALPYEWNGLTINGSGSKSVTFTNKAGCDSVATLNLKVNVATNYTQNTSICSTDLPYHWNGISCPAAGTYTTVLPNKAGCDSTIVLNLAVRLPSSSATDVSICSSELPYSWNGMSCAAAGTYRKTLVNSVGCDSLTTLNLKVNYPATSVTKYAVGSTLLPVEWNNMKCPVAGTYQKVLRSAAGCDSIAQFVLSVHPATTATINAAICQNESFLFNGKNYFDAGTYTATLINALGSDSIATLNLTVNSIYNTSQTVKLFVGDKYRINNHTYDKDGVYTDVLKTTSGCDSTVVTTLTYIEIPNTFTPNGDGINDRFMKDWHIQIFNRNGIKMYDGVDGWDGTYNGQQVSRDTYFYVLFYISESRKKTKDGYITVVR